MSQSIDVLVSSKTIDTHLPANHATEDPPVAYGEQPQICRPRDCNFIKLTGSPQKAGEGDHRIPSATPDNLSTSARIGATYANHSLNTAQSYQKSSHPLVVKTSWTSRISQEYEKKWPPDLGNGALHPLEETASMAACAPSSEQMYLPQCTCDRNITGRMRQSLVVETSTGRQKLVRSKQLSLVQTLQDSPQFPRRKPKPRRIKTRSTETEQSSIKRLPFDSRITSAISVQQVKPNATVKTIQGRTRSAHAAVRSRLTGSVIVESDALKFQNKLLTPSSHSPKGISDRRHRSQTHVGRVGSSLKGNSDCTAPVVRLDGRNNSSRQRISSASSSSSTPRTLTASGAIAIGPVHVMHATPKHAACVTWRSRLFEETGGVDSIAKARNYAMNYIKDSRSVSNLRPVNMTGYPKCPGEPPPVNSSLSTIPPVSRSNARCPSRSTNSLECSVSCPQPAIYSSTLSRLSANSGSVECPFSGRTAPKRNTEEEVTADSSTIKQNSADDSHDNMKCSTETRQCMPEVLVGRWFDINDDCIAEVDPATFSRVFEGPECAYMLFYRLMSLPLPVNLLRP
ncbi:unnamed protein product [Dicrocoelium dendriticum]|nr:unnamed protein product [Dicrocoelium dendriticum]